jgi:hypothetical protein
MIIVVEKWFYLITEDCLFDSHVLDHISNSEDASSIKLSLHLPLQSSLSIIW